MEREETLTTSPFVSTLILFFLPVLLFFAIAVLVGEASLNVALPATSKFKEFWELLGSIGNTLSGIGTLFLALAVGASFVTFFAQFWQLGLQQQQAKESREQLLETAKIQAENLKVLQRQAAAALLATQIQSLTSRLAAAAKNDLSCRRPMKELPTISRGAFRCGASSRRLASFHLLGVSDPTSFRQSFLLACCTGVSYFRSGAKILSIRRCK
jgi:hypothetical protein